jgi:hypothetical protein
LVGQDNKTINQKLALIKKEIKNQNRWFQKILKIKELELKVFPHAENLA